MISGSLKSFLYNRRYISVVKLVCLQSISSAMTGKWNRKFLDETCILRVWLHSKWWSWQCIGSYSPTMKLYYLSAKKRNWQIWNELMHNSWPPRKTQVTWEKNSSYIFNSILNNGMKTCEKRLQFLFKRIHSTKAD